jgi:hypothetical protein
LPETFNNDDDEPGVESDYILPGSEDRPGPPDDWQRDSWFDFKNGEWWYRFPVRLDGGCMATRPAAGDPAGPRRRRIHHRQLIAQAREPEGDAARRMLLGYGLRLSKLAGESWNEAWLAIANKHPGLDRLFVDYPNYRGQRRTQILSGLRRRVGAVEHEANPSEIPLRFAGPQSRALLVPPELLPSAADDKHDADPRGPKDIPQ